MTHESQSAWIFAIKAQPPSPIHYDSTLRTLEQKLTCLLQLLRCYWQDITTRLPTQRSRRAPIACQDHWHNGDHFYHWRTYLPYVRCRRPAVRTEEVDPLLRKCHNHPLPRRDFRIRPAPFRRRDCQSDARSPHPLRLDLQFPMVRQDLDYSFLKQDRPIQGETARFPNEELFPRL